MVSGINNYLYSNGIYSRNIYNNYNRNAVSAIDRLQPLNRNEVKNFNYNRQLSKDTQNFLKAYQSDYNKLQQAANNLTQYGTSSIWNNITAKSNDTDIVDVKNNYSSQVKGSYALDVSQLAQAQQNESQALKSNEQTALTSGYLEINSGGNRHVVNVNIAKDMTNKDALASIAKSINDRKLGISATVSEKDGQSQLILKGDRTGDGNDFSVAGSKELIGQTGLDKVAQNAQDAVYSFNGQKRHSSTNEVALDSYRVSAQLNGTGKTTIDFGTSSDTVKDALQKLVDAHNSVLKTLNDNADRGSAVLTQMKNLLIPPISEKSMNAIGLSYNKDGSLALDGDKFAKAYTTDPKNTRELLSGNYSIAKGLASDAQKALSQPSYKLVDGANQAENNLSNYEAQIKENPFRYYNAFANRGAYNLMNFSTMGLFLNRLI